MGINDIIPSKIKFSSWVTHKNFLPLCGAGFCTLEGVLHMCLCPALPRPESKDLNKYLTLVIARFPSRAVCRYPCASTNARTHYTNSQDCKM